MNDRVNGIGLEQSSRERTTERSEADKPVSYRTCHGVSVEEMEREAVDSEGRSLPKVT